VLTPNSTATRRIVNPDAYARTTARRRSAAAVSIAPVLVHQPGSDHSPLQRVMRLLAVPIVQATGRRGRSRPDGRMRQAAD